MSVPFSCKCGERRKPVRDRRWRVSKRHYRQSAFDGWIMMRSDYSEVHCLSCKSVGRTKAAYVEQLQDGKL